MKGKIEKSITGFKECAKYSVNGYFGCSNDCLCCDAKGMAVRFGQVHY
jgi:DNA repair photolyase